MIVVDASVAAKWIFLEEEHANKAEHLLSSSLTASVPIVAPPLLWSEVTNIVRQRMRSGVLDLSEAQERLSRFLALPLSLHGPPAMYRVALQVADQYALPSAYDAEYVVLADILGSTLWTDDQRLLRTLAGRLSFVRSIKDYNDTSIT